jgi:hypothetical protein
MNFKLFYSQFLVTLIYSLRPTLNKIEKFHHNLIREHNLVLVDNKLSLTDLLLHRSGVTTNIYSNDLFEKVRINRFISKSYPLEFSFNSIWYPNNKFKVPIFSFDFFAMKDFNTYPILNNMVIKKKIDGNMIVLEKNKMNKKKIDTCHFGYLINVYKNNNQLENVRNKYMNLWSPLPEYLSSFNSILSKDYFYSNRIDDILEVLNEYFENYYKIISDEKSDNNCSELFPDDYDYDYYNFIRYKIDLKLPPH